VRRSAGRRRLLRNGCHGPVLLAGGPASGVVGRAGCKSGPSLPAYKRLIAADPSALPRALPRCDGLLRRALSERPLTARELVPPAWPGSSPSVSAPAMACELCHRSPAAPRSRCCAARYTGVPGSSRRFSLPSVNRFARRARPGILAPKETQPPAMRTGSARFFTLLTIESNHCGAGSRRDRPSRRLRELTTAALT